MSNSSDFIEFLWGFVFFALDKKSVDIQIDSVFITTYHRVKGLEFPVVLMPFLYEGNLPSSSKSDSLFGEKNIILNKSNNHKEK